MKLFKEIPKFKLTSSNMLNAVGVLIVVYLVVVLGQTVKRNYDLGLQINGLKSQMNMLQDQNDELSYNIQYYKTDSFKDREARSQLGLQLPGENVVIIPNDTPAPTPTVTPEKTTAPKSNMEQWIDFLGGNS
ncbi:MAG TPA: septum formation initiator family protein [Candidatus Saccharimonadia bacterium]|nr:septum formation initiator family protein [Candidatus Saccharimonadia bacterium]